MSIGGRLDHNAYNLLAITHRPTDREGQRLAALDLARQRLTHRDIAHVLGLSEAAVAELLKSPDVSSRAHSRAPILSLADAAAAHAGAWRRSISKSDGTTGD